MNALELADLMEKYSVAGFMNPLADEFKQAANMLRQQQAEIDLLRMTQPNIDYDKELLKPTFVGRELTDEEILIVWTSSNFVRYAENGHIDEIFFNKFANAILRKAQEK